MKVHSLGQMGSVVGGKVSMVMDGTVVGNYCTHRDIPSVLARDLNTLDDDFTFPPLSLCEIESNLINEDKLVLYCSHL